MHFLTDVELNLNPLCDSPSTLLDEGHGKMMFGSAVLGTASVLGRTNVIRGVPASGNALSGFSYVPD